MTTGGENGHEPASGPFDIYETADGPRHIGNPARRRILAKMRGRELTVPEMLEVTGLSKSTISTHLGILFEQNLIAYREDPADRRRKLYYLTSRHVGTARRCGERIQVADPSRDLPLDGGLGAGVVSRLLLRAFLAELACCGLDLEPVARETGRRVGELVGRDRPAVDVAAWVDDVTAFWQEAGLGTLRVADGHSDGKPFLRVDECRVCCAGNEGSIGLCVVTAGLIEGMASEALRTMVEVRRVPPTADEPAHACGCHFEVLVPTDVIAAPPADGGATAA